MLMEYYHCIEILSSLFCTVPLWTDLSSHPSKYQVCKIET